MGGNAGADKSAESRPAADGRRAASGGRAASEAHEPDPADVGGKAAASGGPAAGPGGGRAPDAASATAGAPAASLPRPMTTVILVWCALAVVSSLYVTIPLTPLFAERFAAPLHAAAWPGSSFSLAYAVGLPIWGTLSDRYGRKAVIVAGLTALAVLSPLAGLADSLPLLAAIRAAQGLAASSFAPAALAYAAETYPPGRSVAVIGLITAGFMSAGVAGQLFASAVEQRLGWPRVFHLLGAVYALSAAWVGGRLPGAAARGRNERMAERFRVLLTLPRRKKLPACYLIAGTLLLAFVGMYTGLEAVLTRPPFGLGPGEMLLVRAAGLPGVLLSPLAGRLSAKYGYRAVLRSGLATAFTGLACMAAGMPAPVPVLPIVIPASFMAAAGIALAIPPLIAIIGMLGGEARAFAVTLYTFILFIGATIGPQAVLWTLRAAGRDFAPFVPLAVLMFAGWMLSRRLPDPER